MLERAPILHSISPVVRMIIERAPNTAVDYVDAPGAAALLVAAQSHHAPDIIRLLADRATNVITSTNGSGMGGLQAFPSANGSGGGSHVARCAWTCRRNSPPPPRRASRG